MDKKKSIVRSIEKEKCNWLCMKHKELKRKARKTGTTQYCKCAAGEVYFWIVEEEE